LLQERHSYTFPTVTQAESRFAERKSAAEAAAYAAVEEAAAKAKTAKMDGLISDIQHSYTSAPGQQKGSSKTPPPPLVTVMTPGGTIRPAFRSAEDTPSALFARLPPLI
jgi:hypothetical protein